MYPPAPYYSCPPSELPPEFVFDDSYAQGAALLSIDQVKTLCKIELTDDDPDDPANIARDAALVNLEATARDYCESLSGFTFTPHVFRIVCPRPSMDGRVYLRKTPVTAITTVKMKQSDGTTKTLVSGTDYLPWLVGNDPSIAPPSGGSFWTTLKVDPPQQDAIEIIFTAGFASGKLPPRFLDGVRTFISYRNDNPGDVTTVPEAVNSYCRTSRVRRRGPHG